MPGSNDHSLRKRAERLVLEGEYLRALEVYRAVLASDDGNPKAWYGIGYTYYKLGRHDQSEAALREASNGGYWPARQILNRLQVRGEDKAGAAPSERIGEEPLFARGAPPPPRQSGALAGLRHERRHRKEELIAFLDRLASRAMATPGYLTDADCAEVNKAHGTHEVAGEHLKTCRRALSALEKPNPQAGEVAGGEEGGAGGGARTLEDARRAFAEAEADEEALRKILRRARRRLAIMVIERHDAPEGLAHFIAEIEALRAELAAIESRLGAAEEAVAQGRDPRRESGVGAAG